MHYCFGGMGGVLACVCLVGIGYWVLSMAGRVVCMGFLGSWEEWGLRGSRRHGGTGGLKAVWE